METIASPYKSNPHIHTFSIPPLPPEGGKGDHIGGPRPRTLPQPSTHPPLPSWTDSDPDPIRNP